MASAFQHIVVLLPNANPGVDIVFTAAGFHPSLRSADGRWPIGLWESQVQDVLTRRGWTLAGLRTRLTNAGCTFITRTHDDDADPDGGTRWQARNAWVAQQPVDL